MREGMTNYLQVRVKGMDLTTCTDMVLMIEQCGRTRTYTGTANSENHELMDITILKADALQYKAAPAKFQVALTDANGMPRSHDPVWAEIGELLEVSGYGM